MTDMWEDPIDGEQWYNYEKHRKNFAGRVFLITGVMLLVVSFIIALPHLSDEIKESIVYNIWAYSIPPLITILITVIILSCVYKARHCFPVNVILLSILCLSYGLLAAVISCRYSLVVIVISAVTTAGIVIIIGALAKWGPFDVTGCGMLMCGLSIGLVVIVVVSMIVGFFYYIPLLHLIISCIVVAVFILFLLYDLQLILGGRKKEIARDEYILGAMILFMDIMIIFIYMLQIVNASFSRN